MNGFIPLHYAIIYGHVECIDYLLMYGSDVNIKTQTDGYTVFHLSLFCLNQMVLTLKTLLEYNNDRRGKLKLNINTKDSNGNSPLLLSLIKHISEDVLKILIQVCF